MSPDPPASTILPALFPVGPILSVVAAPPMLKLVTAELNKVAVLVVEVMSALVAPFTPRSPAILVSFCSSMVPNGFKMMFPEVAVARLKLPLVFVQPEAPPEVKPRVFKPVLMEELERPDSVSAPDVAVRFSAPVVKLKPVAKAPVPVKLAAEDIVWPLIKPEVVIVPDPKLKASSALACDKVVPLLVQYP